MEVKGKILVVDDDSISRIVLEKHLKKKGYEVLSADSAIKAGQLMKADNIFLVITDVNMPQVSGLEFLLWVKEFKPACQVVLMTGEDTKIIDAFIKKSGKVTFFKKPIDVNKLDDFLDNDLMKKKFRSTITDISLIDFIKMAVVLNKKKLTQVIDPINNRKGLIYIREGKIIHIEMGELYGEKALYEIANIRKGVFKEIPWEEPQKQSGLYLDTLVLIENAESIIQQIAIENTISSSLDTVKNNKILILEDEITTLTLMQRYFTSKGFQVSVGESGLDGIDLVQKEFFNLVITDLNMPNMGGLEFFLWLNQHSPRTKVIFMTAFGSESIKEFVRQNGAINYFEKPVDLKEMESFIIELSAGGVSGDIQDITFSDFLQILQLSGEQKYIRVTEPITNKEGHIFIMSGNVIHAETENLTGEKAFYSILGMSTAIFAEEDWVVPSEITMNDSIAKLLAEAEKSVYYKKSMGLLDQEAVDQIEKENQKALVRAVPTYIEKALEEKKALDTISNEVDPIKRLTIYENGVAMEIILGKSTKSDVISVMKKYSKVIINLNTVGQIIIFDDLSVNVLFNESGFAEEINFGSFYRGKTSNGVSIGDTLEKAISIYGKPKIGTMRGVVWDNLAFFSQDGKTITSMRMRNKNILDNRDESAKKVTKPIIQSKKEEPLTINNIQSKVEELKNEIAQIEQDKQQALISESQRNDKLFIDDNQLIVLGIKIGKSTRDDVRIKMHELNYMISRTQSHAKCFAYDDISLKVNFDDKGIVEEFCFGNLYSGKTQKGVGIGDNINNFVKAYGTPSERKGNDFIWRGVWATIIVTANDINLVTELKIKK